MTDRPPVVFLHIGAMKTGTTYLQQVLLQNSDALAEHGYLFPGETWGDQVRAAHDAVGHHRERGVRERAAGSWARMVEDLLAHDGPASILSVEFLSFAGRRAARRIVEDLRDAEVHVVLTVRDTCEVLPGLWQTHCANGGTASWAAFARSARLGSWAGPTAPLLGQGSRLFRRALDVPRMLGVWRAVVPAERVHVVTVPPPGSPRGLLWERFASVVGVDPTVASRPAQGHNPSLGYPSADLMRRLNRELGRLPRGRYNPTLKHYLAEQVLGERSGQEPRVRLDRRAHSFGLRWNARVRTAVERSGARVVGELEDLPTTAATVGFVDSIEPPDEADLLAAAETAAAGLEKLVRRRRRRLRRRRRARRQRSRSGLAQPGRPHVTVDRRARWEREDRPVRAAVRDLAEVAVVAITLKERLARSARRA